MTAVEEMDRALLHLRETGKKLRGKDRKHNREVTQMLEETRAGFAAGEMNAEDVDRFEYQACRLVGGIPTRQMGNRGVVDTWMVGNENARQNVEYVRNLAALMRREMVETAGAGAGAK